ncbi:MAG: hypothetical protein ACRC7O_13595 [Fimbriiglobus sp.]
MNDFPTGPHAGHHDCGHCGACQWWQTDPTAHHAAGAVGLFLHDEIAHFNLQVSADSGCNRFHEAAVAVEAAVGAGI